MLTKKEEKLIIKYNILPPIGIVAFLIALCSPVVWFVLVLIDNLAYDNRMVWSFGAYVEVGIAVVYCVIMAYGILVPRFGMKGKKWRALVNRLSVKQDGKDFSGEMTGAFATMGVGNVMQTIGERTGKEALEKAGRVTEVAGQVAAATTAMGIAAEMGENASRVAKAYGVKIPKIKYWIVAMAIIPVVVLVSVYIPHYKDMGAQRQAETEVISQTVNRVREVFEESGCSRVSYDEPLETFMPYTYNVTGYLYEGCEQNAYIDVQIDRSGVVVSVNYSFDIDVTKDKEKNKQSVETDLATMHEMFENAGVTMASDELLSIKEIPDAFWDEFMNTSYYEDVRIAEDGQENTTYSVSYNTEPEDEFNEYSRAYVYFAIDYEEP